MDGVFLGISLSCQFVVVDSSLSPVMDGFRVGDSGKKDDLLSDWALPLSLISFSLKMLMFSRNVRGGW